MSIMNINLYGMASLAEASYVLWYKDGLPVINFNDQAAVIAALKSSGNRNGIFSEQQAQDFWENWQVISHQANTESGFSATLFKNKISGEYVYATRGTEAGAQWGVDLLGADVGDIITDGLAIKQTIDMYNDYQRLNTATGFVYQAAYLETDIALTAGYEAARLAGATALQNYRAYLATLGNVVIDEPFGGVQRILKNDSTIVFSDARAHASGELHGVAATISATGHSLGGHLAEAFTRLFPELNASAVPINGAGFANGIINGLSGNADINVAHLFGTLAPSNTGFGDILNLHGSAGWNFVAQNLPFGLVQPGGWQEIFTESWNAFDEVVGHGKDQMTDSLAVYDLFFRLNPALANSSTSDAMSAVRAFFESAANVGVKSLEGVVNAFGKMFVPNYQAIDEELHINATAEYAAEVRTNLYERIFAIRTAIEGKNASFLSLNAGATSLATADTAEGRAYRFALVNLLPFAINMDSYIGTEANAAQYNADHFTAEYLQDRAQYLTSIINRNLYDNSIMLAPAQVYVSDLSRPDEPEYPVFGTALPYRKITFGSELGDIAGLEGGTKADRLYGGGGADFLTGNGGNDYLEGGTGNDTYIFNIAEEFGNDIVVDNVENGMVGGRLSINGETLSATVVRTTNSESASDGLYRFVNTDGSPQTGRKYWSAALNGTSLILFVADNAGLFKGTITLKNYSETNNYGITLNNTAVVPAAVNSSGYAADFQYIDGWDEYYNTGTIGLSTFTNDHGTHNQLVSNGVWRDYETRKNSYEQSYNNTHLKYEADIYYAGTQDEMQILTRLFESGAASDLLIGSSRDDLVYPATPTLNNWLINNQVVGDIISGNLGDDVIYGDGMGSGSAATGDIDVLIGGKGSDEIHGGGGDDYVYAREEYQDWYIKSPHGWRDVAFDIYPITVAGYSMFNSYDYYVRESLSVSGSLLENAGDINYLYGDAGNDHIAGGSYQDIIDGGTGSDVIYAGAGCDVISGGDNTASPYDVLLGDSYAQVMLSTQGAIDSFGLDLIAPVLGATVATAERTYYASALFNAKTDYNDYIDGGAGSDIIAGEMGGDIILGGEGDDFMMGDRLNDVAWWSASFSGVGLHYSNLDVQFHGNDVMVGGAGADTIFGDSGDDVIDGGSGADVICGDDYMIDSSHIGYGDDALYGGDGNDMLVGGDGNDLIHGGKDNDLIRGGGKNANGTSIAETNGNDSLYGDEGDDTVYGDGGDDYIEGGEGNDQLMGDYPGGPVLAGKGNDIVFGNAGNDSLWGDDGDDTLDGGTGSDRLFGGNDVDTMIGGIGADFLDGGAGNDMYVFHAGDGVDTISANDSSVNTALLDVSSASIHYVSNSYINLYYTAADYIAMSTVTYQSMQIINGSVPVSLNITGTDDASSVYGDIIYTPANNNNTVHAGAGNDYVHGYGLHDVIDGGVGNDQLYYHGTGDATLSGNEGNDDISVFSAAAGTHITMDGGNGNDSLYYRGDGSVVLRGGAGNDTLTGGAGQDDFTGGSGEDQFNFSEGFGSDVLHLDAGEGANDAIVFSLNDSTKPWNDLLIANNEMDTTISFKNSADMLHMVGALSDAPGILFANSAARIVYAASVDHKYAIKVDRIVYQMRTGEESVTLPILAAIVDRQGNFTRVASDETCIDGDTGADVIIGTRQGVTLNGGAGDDTYLGAVSGYAVAFGLGDDKDTVYTLETNLDESHVDADNSASRYLHPNTVQISAGTTADEMLFTRDGDDLLLYLGLDTHAADVLRVQNQFAVSWWGRPGVDYIDFADAPAASMDRDAMLQRVAVDMLAIASWPSSSAVDSFSSVSNDPQTVDTLWAVSA